MDTAAFDYELPATCIAQQPIEPRDAARLLVDGGPEGPVRHRTIADLPALVGPGDVVVVNDTEVLRARLRLRKATGGAAEVLLLEPDPADDRSWSALVRPGRRLPPGTHLFATADAPDAPDAPGSAAAVVEVLGADESGSDSDAGRDRDGVRRVRLLDAPSTVMARAGVVPLPPYITAPLEDASRYQTVYAAHPGSVAAPTAGLHLTEGVLDDCRARGATVATVELAVGLGTFRPLSATTVEAHTMHEERYRVPESTMAACAAARRVVAVGTTTVRSLESAAATGTLEGRTSLFIRRPYPFAVVDVLLTNFHLPRSSLLVMIDAFVGPRWRHLYEVALAEGYRFLSFGDAMLLTRVEAP